MKSAEEIKRQADALQSEYEGKKSKLYRTDGEKLYSEAEHREQLRALQQERNQKLDLLGAEANAAMQEAETESANIKSEDLSGRLTSEELANANSRHVFISEDIAKMPVRAIDARVDSVLASGDRSSMYLHARALHKRSSESDSPTGAESAAKRLEDALFGEKRQGDIEAADKRAQEYLSAQLRTSTLKRGATTPAGAWAAGLVGRRA